MEGSELILLLSLSAILVLLKFYNRKDSGIEKAGSGIHKGPVRSRPRRDYTAGNAQQ